MYFRVSDPIASVANVSSADYATRLLAQTTLRNVLGTKNLAEVLSDRESISHSMQVRKNDTGGYITTFDHRILIAIYLFIHLVYQAIIYYL